MNTCPECKGGRIKRDTHRVRSNGKLVGVGWYVCLDCWHKWDGVTQDDSPLTVPGVVPRRGIRCQQ